jgi:hypothetical protein
MLFYLAACGLVVRVNGYRSRGPGSIPGATRFFWEEVGLEGDPLSLESTIEELLGRNGSGSSLESREYGRNIRQADHVTHSIRKSWPYPSRQAAVVRSL